MTRALIGPISHLVTMSGLPEAGPLSDSNLEVIQGGGLVVKNGRIRSVGRYIDLDGDFDRRIEFEGSVTLVPGFIDAHTHICFAGSRAHEYALRCAGASYQEIGASGGGILSTVESTRRASLEELVAAVVLRAERMLEWGVTTAEVKSGYGLTVEAELKMLHAIKTASQNGVITLVSTCLAAHTCPPEFESKEEYLTHIADLLFPKLREERLTQRIDIFVEEKAFPADMATDYLKRAREWGFDLIVHGDQFTLGGSQLAAEIGALSVDHCEQTDAPSAKRLKASGVIPIALPGASMGLGMKFASGRLLLDEGLPLVIASDWNPGTAPMGDLLTQAAVYSAFEKLTMAETLAALTCRAARALKLSDRGALKPGMRADFSIFPTDDYRDILYHQGSLKPSQVFIEGEEVYAC